MKEELDRKDRVELAEHERIAESLGMEFEKYVQKVIMPTHIAGGMPIFGVLRRKELWQLDKERGLNWWKTEIKQQGGENA